MHCPNRVLRYSRLPLLHTHIFNQILKPPLCLILAYFELSDWQGGGRAIHGCSKP